MKKFNQLTLATNMIMFCIIACNFFLLVYIKTKLITLIRPPDWMSLLVAGFLFLIALGHVLSLSNLVIQFRKLMDESLIRSIAFALGIFSLFLIAVDVIMLTDIGNEYMAHDISGEWMILFANQGIHAAFFLVSIIQGLAVNERMNSMNSIPKALVDESTLLTIHQIGVFSALCGFLSIISLIGMGIAEMYLTGLLLIASIVLSLPYGMSVLYWFYTKRKVKPADWYDEKQFLDISRGALVTLVISTTLMIGFFLLFSLKVIDFNLILLFPIYSFLVEFCFSGSALYFSKRV